MLGGIVGRKNAKRGTMHLFNSFQNLRLNQHLIYTIFDEIIVELFPEIDGFVRKR